MWRAGSSDGGGILHIIHEGCTHNLGSCTAESVASQPTPSTHIAASTNGGASANTHARAFTQYYSNFSNHCTHVPLSCFETMCC